MDTSCNMSPEQNRSQIWSMLALAGLEKYMELFDGAGIDFHAFCNLTRDDMRRLGIINYADQSVLIEIVRPMASMYKDLVNYKIDWAQIAKNMSTSSELLAYSLTAVNQTLKESPINYQSLVDFDTTSGQALQVLLDLMESRIDIMDQDLREFLRKAEGGGQRSEHSRKKLVFSSLLALAGTAAAIWYIKTPYQVPGFRFLAK